MSKAEILLIFCGIFALSALPAMLMQPSGIASAGLTAGFTMPFNHGWHVPLLLALGAWGMLLGKEPAMALPCVFLTMLLLGATVDLTTQHTSALRMVIFGAVLTYAIALSVVNTRAYLVSGVLFSAVAFHWGTEYFHGRPEIASHLYYLTGILLCSALLMAAGASLGVAIASPMREAVRRIREVPAVASLLSML